MIAPVRKSRRPKSGWHRAFLAMLPAMVQHFRMAFRHLRPEAKTEAIQEATANACVAYRRLAMQGRTDRAFFSALARFAVRQVNDCRRVGTSQNIRDASSELARRKGRVVLERLDHFDEESQEWQEAIVEDHHTPVFDQVWFRIDFPAWLAGLGSRDRKIATSLAVGNSTGVVARRFRVSAGRISQLRRELCDSWKEFLGETRVTEM
jgi:hypothetical protein